MNETNTQNPNLQEMREEMVNNIIEENQSKVRRSKDIVELVKALAKFQGEVDTVAIDADNPFFKSRYATLKSVVETIRGPLSKNGLSYTQHPTGDGNMTTIIFHTSGQWMESSYQIKPTKNDAQGIGSAITYQKRYALLAVLGLATDEADDDGNDASKKKGDKTTPEDAIKKIEKVKTLQILNVIQEKLNEKNPYNKTDTKKVQDAINRKKAELEKK